MPAGMVRSSLVLIPVLLALLIVANTDWIHDACDEFIRELVGFPRLSMLTVNLFGWSIFNLSMLHVIARSLR